MTAHERWERRSNEINRKRRNGTYSDAVALRLHIRNDRIYDDDLQVEERASRGEALADYAEAARPVRRR